MATPDAQQFPVVTGVVLIVGLYALSVTVFAWLS